MADISVTINGTDDAKKMLTRVVSIDSMRPPMFRAVLRLERDMKKYPPQRANSSYIRTGTLGRRWTHKVTQSSNGLKGIVGNNTVYAPYVQSHEFQADIHKELWQNTDRAVLDGNRSAIIADFERAIREASK